MGRRASSSVLSALVRDGRVPHLVGITRVVDGDLPLGALERDDLRDVGRGAGVSATRHRARRMSSSRALGSDADEFSTSVLFGSTVSTRVYVTRHSESRARSREERARGRGDGDDGDASAAAPPRPLQRRRRRREPRRRRRRRRTTERKVPHACALALVRRGHRARSPVRVRAGRPRRGPGVRGSGLPRRARSRGGGGARGRVRQRRARRAGLDPALEARRGAAHRAKRRRRRRRSPSRCRRRRWRCAFASRRRSATTTAGGRRGCASSAPGPARRAFSSPACSPPSATQNLRPLVLLTDRDTAALEVIASNVRLNARGWARCVPQRLQWDRRDERSRATRRADDDRLRSRSIFIRSLSRHRSTSCSRRTSSAGRESTTRATCWTPRRSC